MSAVVVLSSSLNVGDPSDFTAALMMQTLFDLKEPIDIIPMVLHERMVRLKDWEDIVRDWSEHRNVTLTQYSKEDYVGEYKGLGITLTVREKALSGQLELVFNGREDIVQCLEHYNEDMYSYLPTNRDDWLKGAWLDWDYYMVGILHFRRDSGGRVVGLAWTWERGCDPVIFRKNGN
jgi:hypothetical protein